VAKILFYGNCQVEALAKYAAAHSSVHELQVLRNYELIANPSLVPQALRCLEGVDVVIFQPLDDRHGALATTERGIFGRLGGVDRLSLPYVYNSALWPTFPEGDRFHEEDLVASLVSNPTPEAALREYLLGGKDFCYEARMDGTLERLRAHEATTNVRVADFIAENFVERRLFFTQNHPTSYVFGELIDQFNSLVTGVFPTRGSVERAGLNFAGLPLTWDIDLSAFQQWRYKWCEGSEVLAGTRRFVESWPEIRSSRDRHQENSPKLDGPMEEDPL
jgi:hypothetical protein